MQLLDEPHSFDNTFEIIFGIPGGHLNPCSADGTWVFNGHVCSSRCICRKDEWRQMDLIG